MEEPIVETKCDVSDAVHPRFASKQKPEEINEFLEENEYFCVQCNLFFSSTPEGLKIHFDGVMVEHRPFGPCFYCNGNVFEYRFKRDRQFYHNCPKLQ